MRFVLFILITALLCARIVRAEDAASCHEKGIEALKASQDDPAKIVAAAHAFSRASQLYQAALNDEAAVEMNSYLYWCKKKMTLVEIEEFKKIADADAAKIIEQVEQPIAETEAQAWMTRVEKFAAKHPSEHYLIAVRYFEIAGRFKGTQLSLDATDRSLRELQLIQARPKTASAFTGGPAAPAADGSPRLPVPTADERKRAEATIHDAYKDDYAKRAPADRIALVQMLLRQGEKPDDDKAIQYTLSQEALTIATQLGQLSAALSAIDQLCKTFSVDAIQLKTEALGKLGLVVKSPEDLGMLTRAYVELITQCIAQEKYDPVAKIAVAATDAARRAQDTKSAAAIQALAKEARDVAAEFQKFSAAQNTLATKPADPAANTNAGRYLCYVKNQWDKGLPMLQKGSDAALKMQAEKEAANPSEFKDLMSIAEVWFELGAKADNKAVQQNVKNHAAQWYEKALAVAPNLMKAKIEKRLDDILLGSLKNPPKPVSESERAAAARERKEQLAKLESETSKTKSGYARLKAANAAVKLGEFRSALVEFDQAAADLGDHDYGNPAGQAMIAKGKLLGTLERWPEAEATLAKCWQRYRGQYSANACAAAEVMIDHHMSADDADKAMPFREIIIKYGGLNGDPAAVQCNWLADYYLKKGDKARAISYLTMIVDKFYGLNGIAKKAAEAKLEKLKGQ